MQTNFKRVISTLDNKTYVFHFNRIYTVNGTAYHISVRTIGSISYYFMMHEQNDGWYFTDITELPQWLIEMERKFEDAILESIKES